MPTSKRPRTRQKLDCSGVCARLLRNSLEIWGWSSRSPPCGGAASCLPGRRSCWSWTSSNNGSSPGAARRTPSLLPRSGTATASTSRRSCWCGMISGWRPADSCVSSRSRCSKGITAPWSISSIPAMPRRCSPPSGELMAPCPKTPSILTSDQESFLDRSISERRPSTGRSSSSSIGPLRRDGQSANPGPPPRSRKWAVPKESVWRSSKKPSVPQLPLPNINCIRRPRRQS